MEALSGDNIKQGEININKAENGKNVSLKDYFDIRFSELIKYIDTKFLGIEKSTLLAQENLNTRLEAMNEFRNSMKDQAQQYITRADHETLIAKTDADVRYLREATAESKGKASQQSVNIAYLFAFIGIIIAIVGLVKEFLI